MATPLALGYAVHVTRRGTARLLGRVALAVAATEALACLALAALWLRNYLV